MNWIKIDEKYPRAFSLFVKLKGWDSFTFSMLVDFFHNHGIYISIDFDKHNSNKPWSSGCAYGRKFYPVIKQFSSRQKAENAAFKKAFKILEYNL